MLILPFLNDQPLNALQVHRHGLDIGISLGKATSYEVYAALGRLTESQSVRGPIIKMQALFREREQEKIAASVC